MLSRLNLVHDFIITKYGRDWHESATQGFTETDQIRFYFLMFKAKHFSGSSEACLDLVTNEEHVVLLAKSLDLLQVA